MKQLVTLLIVLLGLLPFSTLALEPLPTLHETVIKTSTAADLKTKQEGTLQTPRGPKMLAQKTAILRALDKVTARTTTFSVDVGKTVQFERIFIRVQACNRAAPLEDPESAAFLQTWETSIESEKPEWIFSGWMFASSPSLSAMDHAVYDVWVLDCISDSGKSSAAATEGSSAK